MTIEREIELQFLETCDEFLGFYQNWGENHLISMVRTLPLSTFIAVLAHELTHAWQNEHCVRQSKEVTEGLASWIEHKVLYELEWDYTTKLLEESTTPCYGPGLRKCLRWEQILGEAGLMRAVRGWTDFPDPSIVSFAA